MGCCCGKDKHDDDQVELAVINPCVMCKIGPHGKDVTVEGGEAGIFDVSGSGVALGSCELDCDYARWEILIEGGEVVVGVLRYNKKTPVSLDKDFGDVAESWALKDITLHKGDVVGVYWDQTDLPMLSFTINGESIPLSSINRVRPSTDIFPAVSLKQGRCKIIFEDKSFRHPSKSSKYKMILCSSSLI